jgi:hypothetical protein
MISKTSYDNPLPLSCVTCVSNGEVYRSNLLASACLGPDTGHEQIAVTNCPSAGDLWGQIRYSVRWVIIVA